MSYFGGHKGPPYWNLAWRKIVEPVEDVESVEDVKSAIDPWTLFYDLNVRLCFIGGVLGPVCELEAFYSLKVSHIVGDQYQIIGQSTGCNGQIQVI